jgi:hypothetical protein
MKNGNWIALHKELRYFLPHGRSYTLLEAMFSYTLDIDNKKEGTISGYSKLWGWDRKKVRRFMSEVGTGTGHFRDRDGTGKEHHIYLKINNLQDLKDTKGTPEGQGRDTHGDTTINPNPNPKPNKAFSSDSEEIRLVEYFISRIKLNIPDFKEPNKQSWAKDFDLLIRKDEKNSKEVAKLIKWCQEDDFEKANVQSPNKLRKRWNNLFLKMNSSKKEGGFY